MRAFALRGFRGGGAAGGAARAFSSPKLALQGPGGVAAVPDEFIDEAALLGPKERIRKRYRDWVDAGFTGLTVGANQDEAVRFMAELAGLNQRA